MRPTSCGASWSTSCTADRPRRVPANSASRSARPRAAVHIGYSGFVTASDMVASRLARLAVIAARRWTSERWRSMARPSCYSGWSSAKTRFHDKPGAMLLACTAGGDHETELIGWIHEAADRRLARARAGVVRAPSSIGRCRAARRRLRGARAGLPRARPSLSRCRAADRRLRRRTAGRGRAQSSVSRCRAADLPDVVAGLV